LIQELCLLISLISFSIVWNEKNQQDQNNNEEEEKGGGNGYISPTSSSKKKKDNNLIHSPPPSSQTIFPSRNHLNISTNHTNSQLPPPHMNSSQLLLSSQLAGNNNNNGLPSVLRDALRDLNLDYKNDSYWIDKFNDDKLKIHEEDEDEDEEDMESSQFLDIEMSTVSDYQVLNFRMCIYLYIYV